VDYSKVGALIKSLRNEKQMTQKQIASQMNISDKTISKWERGLGCPDVSLLSELSNIFEINIQQILDGQININEKSSGNLKRIKFYICPCCENIINNTGSADIYCCGRKLIPLEAKIPDQDHKVTVEEEDNEYYITFNHEMSKSHYISFLSYVTGDCYLFFKFYPEQAAAVRIPKLATGKLNKKNGAKLYYYCSNHGLWVV